MENGLYRFMHNYLLCNAFILFAFSFFIFPTNDTYYYWTWSQHLELSYLDGPPMIAYLLWLSTHIFGNNFFAIELISILSIYGSTFLIYKIVCLFDSKEVALCAAALWIVFPTATTRFITVSMTLDGLEVFFSLLILYLAFKWIRLQQLRYIYAMGVGFGLGLLAKYNVIVLIAGLMLYFLINSKLRKLYLNPHFYVAIFIALIIFSPVLIWNYQHDWLSFIYQMNLHKWIGKAGTINSATKHGVKGIWFYLSSSVFGVLNIFILIIAYLKLIKLYHVYGKNNIKPKHLLEVPCRVNPTLHNTNTIISSTVSYNKIIVFIIYFILLFWLYQSYSSHIALNYMLIVSSLIVIIVARELIQAKYYKFIKIILVLFSLATIIMLLDKSCLHRSDIANYNKYVKSGLINRL